MLMRLSLTSLLIALTLTASAAEHPTETEALIEIAKARIEQHEIRLKTLQELANLHREAAPGLVQQAKAHVQSTRAELESLQAAHALHRNELNRLQALAAKGAVGAAEVDEARTRLAEASARLVQAQTALQQTEVDVRATELDEQRQQRELAIRMAEATIELLNARADLIHLQHGPSQPADTAATKRGLGTFERIETQQIEVRDRSGRIRASIGVDGQDVLRFSAASEKRPDAFLISVFRDGRSALILRDGLGQNRVSISTQQSGRPAFLLSDGANIILHDSRGRNRAVLSAAEDGEPKLTLYDEKMQPTVLAPDEDR